MNSVNFSAMGIRDDMNFNSRECFFVSDHTRM